MPPNNQDIKRCVEGILEIAKNNNLTSIVVSAKDIHKIIGDYPGNHRIPMVCDVMRKTMPETYEELPNNLKKDGASFKIRYHLINY